MHLCSRSPIFAKILNNLGLQRPSFSVPVSVPKVRGLALKPNASNLSHQRLKPWMPLKSFTQRHCCPLRGSSTIDGGKFAHIAYTQCLQYFEDSTWCKLSSSIAKPLTRGTLDKCINERGPSLGMIECLLREMPNEFSSGCGLGV